MIPESGKGRARLRDMGGLKSLLALLLVVLVYVGASADLGIAPSRFFALETWTNMGDLVMRMGPFYKIDSCNDADVVWGDDEPLSGKTRLNKVAAVCEQDKVLFWYRPDYLMGQITYVGDMWGYLMETFRMAILGAAIGSLLAVPFSLLAAQNIMRFKPVYYLTRNFLNLIRTVPDLVWAVLLTGAFGLGALPGVLALTVFSFGLVAKLLSESIESIDPGPLEAMQACGANALQVIRYGVVPQVMPQYLAYTLYVLEVDVRASAVLGLVGAGGIGHLLLADLNLMRYRNVGAIIVVMLIAVVIMDYISTKLRERLI